MKMISEVIKIVIVIVVVVVVVDWVDDSVQSSSDSRTDGLIHDQRATRLEGEDRNVSSKYSQRYC
jgi:uncharacterized membrane protein